MFEMGNIRIVFVNLTFAVLQQTLMQHEYQLTA